MRHRTAGHKDHFDLKCNINNSNPMVTYTISLESIVDIGHPHCDYLNSTGFQNVSLACLQEDSSLGESLTSLNSVLQWFGYVTLPVLLITGVVGNTMSMVIMRKPVFRHMCFSVLITALSISDIVISIMIPFNKQVVMDLLKWDIRSQGWFGCRTFFWFWRTSKMTSSWLVALISVERFIGVWLPIHVKQICTKKNAYFSVGCVYGGIGIFVLIWSSYCDNMIQGRCLPNYPRSADYVALTKAFIIAGSSIYCYVPALLILIFNVLIIWKIHMGYNPASKSVKSKRKCGTKTWTMLVSISVAYFVLAVPIGVVHGYAVFAGVPLFESKNPTIVLIREVAQILEQANHVVNFFAYVLCNQRFRKEVHGLVSKKVPVLKYRSKLVPTQQTSL